MNFEIIKLSEIYPLELKNIFSNFIKEKKLLYPKFEEWFNKIQKILIFQIKEKYFFALIKKNY